MKILAIGDTHTNLTMVRDIWTKLKDIDLVIHTGDNYTDAQILEEEFGVPFVYVRGNCDGSYCSETCDPHGGDYAIVDTPQGNILVTHGHNEHVKSRLDTLIYKALENDCMAAVFGHTHVSLIEQAEDVCLINPGSLSRPLDGSGGSYAIIRATDDRFDATVVFYNTVMRASKGGSAIENHGGSGGNADDKNSRKSLSSILNYADRF